jgi:DNA polymerase-3 subunit delta
MAEPAPVVYLIHGEDDFATANFVKALQEKLGDPSTAEMNTTIMAGGDFDLEELRNATSAVPFLAKRRLVVLEHPSRKLKSQAQREKFTALLDGLPQSTALVLLEKKALEDKHWLVKWANSAGGSAYIRGFTVPKGPQMARWIVEATKKRGGEITPQAASFLAESVGDNPRMASLEVEKVLAYVNYARPVDVDDVDAVAAYVGGQGDFFKLIDAIAQRNGKNAMGMLQKLLEEQLPIILFFSIVGHFRLLLQAREVYEGGGKDATVAKALGIHPYRAKKLTDQARTLSLETLENIYHRLLDYDLEIKTGQLDTELALETMVAALTA